ncbi:MAG: hypothetical protein K9J12_07500 [Melioribacteraceae bacterium]|nr:hypothetical protein [Melioribacteraceae bacterium]MCF8263643.1 hypothetical protein [Melioribacteraceae bacterium]MCF8431429.1 hypothetical protein [Melioribacteraceae bacterium]
MNSKALMINTSSFLGLLGVMLLFLPSEISHFFGFGTDYEIVLQLMSGIYLGFAMLNWMSKESILGGIYGRPIVLGNFFHFFVGTISLIKFSFKNSDEIAFVVLGAVYSILAVLFGIKLFFHPNVKSK